MDKRILLLTFSDQIDRDKLIGLFNAHAEIENWFYSFPNSIFLVTALSPVQIREILQENFWDARHFIAEVSPGDVGVLPPEHWKFFDEIYKRVVTEQHHISMGEALRNPGILSNPQKSQK